MTPTLSPSSAHPFLIIAESHMSPLKGPNVSNPCDAPSNSPPPYTQSPSSPVLLAEMTTTRTEVVTTTTTETTTHLFSLPYWKRRNGAPSPASQRASIDDLSPSITSSKSGTFPPLVDKALPPTPPEPLDTSFATSEKRDGQILNAPSPVYRPDDVSSQPRKVSTGTQSAAALARAALGIGLPHVGLPQTSASLSRPGSSHGPSGSVYPSSPSPAIRRSKSSHRVLSKRVSETQENDHEQSRVERRQRGLSFSSSSFLNIANSDTKGKGKDAETTFTGPETVKKLPKPLNRKSSFWNRRKGTDVIESMNQVQDDTFVSLPPLPPVHHVSPFDVHGFRDTSNSTTKDFSSPISSHMEQFNGVRPLHPNISSPEMSDGSKSTMPWPTSEQTTSFNGVIESLQSNGTPSSYSRPRRQTSTPFLHRLSLGVFSSGESSPSPSPAPNVHPQSATASTASTNFFSRKHETPIPRPLSEEEESPEVYLMRLRNAVSKSEVAGILASSSDPFYARALREYINQFDFLDIPLDVALRKLLMEVGLPRETQQIDRVMEAFACRYMQCNSGIFVSEDHPYILAFSLIMLHTDTFNPSNKRKMTKSDYIKNTKLPGIPTEILDCFFDNIVFAPFIFIEDPVDFNGQPGLVPDIMRPSMVSTPSSSMSINGSGSFKMGNRVDPYYLITNNLLEPLRVDVNSLVSLENLFTYEGTDGPWDEQQLHQAFVNANVIEIEVPAVNRAMSLFARSPSLKSTPLVSSGTGGDDCTPAQQKGEIWSLKVTKVGILNRKDDVTGGGRKSSNRKWKTWTVVLTGSQLLLFRDHAWAAALSQSCDSSPEQVISPPSSVFRPDESFSVKDAIAVYDSSYTKHEHVMRFVLPDGRQILLQASDAKDLNEWISRINYASSFKTAGVRMRPQGLSSEDALLTGVAAATSHLHDLQKHPSHPNISRARSWDSNAPRDLMEMLTGPPADRNMLKRRVTAVNASGNFDLDVPVAPEVEGAEQFKATFDQVKADLASRAWPSDHEAWLPEEDEVGNVYDSPLDSPVSLDSTNSRLPSRSQIIQTKILELDSKIAATQNHLEADVRFIRNIAILTPFQKSTRSRLATSVQGVAKRITQLRLEMEKLKCHRAVLRCDLSSEGRSWNHSKRVALRVAKKTLQTRRSQTIPAMAVELPKNPLLPDDLSRESPPISQRLGSSPSESFHSAVESGFAWPSSEDLNFLGAQNGSSRPDLSRSSSSFPKEWTHEDNRQRSSSLSSNSNHMPSNHGHENIGHAYCDTQDGAEDDLAEEWNRTRCAQRVSLIHVPPNIMIANRLKNQSNS